MYGNSFNVDYVEANKVYNLTSMREGFENLQILIPPHMIGKTYDREFDIAYCQYIMMNDNVFVEFFRIIQNLYCGLNVYLMISDDEWSENLCQSLLKLIQQRYGYNGYQITVPDDYIDAAMRDETDFDKSYGTINLDQDKLRYEAIVKTMQTHARNADEVNAIEYKYQF